MSNISGLKIQIRRLVTFTLSMLFAASAGAQSSNVKVAQYKDKSGRNVSISYTLSSRQQLEMFRPKKLMQEGAHVRAQIAAQCAAGKKTAFKYARDFAVEVTTFNFAIGLSAGQQMAEDPAWARHFYERTLTDPNAYLAFAGFSLGNHAAANFFSMAGWTHDPCRILKKNSAASLAELEEAKGSQKIFGALAGPIGMSIGLVASSAVQQALGDPNIKMCAAYHIGKIHAAKQVQEAKNGCEKAYEDWVLGAGGKIRDLIPEMISQTAVVAIMATPGMVKAIASNRAKVAAGESVEEAVGGGALKSSALRFAFSRAEGGLVFKGFSAVMTLGRAIPSPVAKAAVAVGNMWLFLELSDFVSPWTRPMTSFFNGQDIGNSLTAIRSDLHALAVNNFVTPAAPPKPAVCSSKNVVHYGDRDWEDIKPASCFAGAPEAPDKKIKRLGEQEKKYRDFLLGETMGAVSNWQDYVLQFTNTYSDARNFYSDVLRHVADHHYRPGSNALYDPQPLWGVPVKIEDDYNDPRTPWLTGKICDLPKDVLARFDAAANVLEKEIKRQQLPVVYMPKVNFGIKYDGASVPLPYMNFSGRKNTTNFFSDEHYEVNMLKTLHDGFSSMNCEKVKSSPQITETVRQQRYNKAISSLFWGLNSHYSMPIDSPAYPQMAESNLLARINMVLGGPEPVWAGVGYIKGLNRDSSTINQDYKNVHPEFVGATIGGIATPTMTDYLLTSMVCGPAASQSIKEHTSIAVSSTLPEVVTAIPQWIREKSGYLPAWLRDRLPFYPKQVGWDLQFNPPRIINPIGISKNFPGGANLCSIDQRGANKLNLAKMTVERGEGIKVLNRKSHTLHYAGIDDRRAAIDPHMTVFEIDGKEYTGLLDVVKAFANKSIVGPDSEHFNFPQWWAQTIDSKAIPLFQKKRHQFISEIVDKKFLPVLTDPSYTTDKNWLVINSKGLAKGLTNSIIDSGKNNIWVINMIAIKGMSPKERQDLVAAEKQVFNHLRLGLMMSGGYKQIRKGIELYKGIYGQVAAADGSTSSQAVNSPLESQAYDYFQANQKAANEAIANLYKVVAQHINPQAVQIKRSVIPSLNAAFENIKGLVTEVDSLHGVVVSVKFEAGS